VKPAHHRGGEVCETLLRAADRIRRIACAVVPVMPVRPVHLSEAQPAPAVLVASRGQLRQRSDRRVVGAQAVLARLAYTGVRRCCAHEAHK